MTIFSKKLCYFDYMFLFFFSTITGQAFRDYQNHTASREWEGLYRAAGVHQRGNYSLFRAQLSGCFQHCFQQRRREQREGKLKRGHWKKIRKILMKFFSHLLVHIEALSFSWSCLILEQKYLYILFLLCYHCYIFLLFFLIFSL